MADAGNVDALTFREGNMFTMAVIDKPDKDWPQDMRFKSKSTEEDDPGKEELQYTVFLVEDDTDDRRQAVEELRKSPYVYNVRCFESGDQLMGHFASEGYYSGNLMRFIPTLILLDIHVPGASGLDILQELKEHPLTEDIPVIMLTGDTSAHAAQEAQQYGANAFIEKPLKLDHVHEVIYTGRSWPATKPPQ